MADKKLIDELLERNKPMPMGRYFWGEDAEFLGKESSDMCGVCGHIIQDSFDFCPRCGQRVDHENYKL